MLLKYMQTGAASVNNEFIRTYTVDKRTSSVRYEQHNTDFTPTGAMIAGIPPKKRGDRTMMGPGRFAVAELLRPRHPHAICQQASRLSRCCRQCTKSLDRNTAMIATVNRIDRSLGQTSIGNRTSYGATGTHDGLIRCRRPPPRIGNRVNV